MATLACVVEPISALTDRERAWLESIAPAPGAPADECRLRIVEEPLFEVPEGTPLPDRAPAALQIVNGRIRILHRRYMAELEPLSLEVRLFRRHPDGGGLGVAVRTAACCRLPLRGGLPLHAAGVVVDGRGVAFFGPSGAGKSTLASTCPDDVLSDELVLLEGHPFRLQASGFWGTLPPTLSRSGPAPLAALVQLDKGPAFSLERLDAREARRRLMDVVLLPLHAGLWSAALAVLGRLTSEVPVYRMAWSPRFPPWREIRTLLAEIRPQELDG